MQREPDEPLMDEPLMDETMTMARIEAEADSAVLVVTSRDQNGQYVEARYAMDALMACALRLIAARELVHIEMPPMRTHEELLAALAEI